MNAQTGSYIDMKNMLFILEDGYTDTLAVNLKAGYAKGDSSIAVDGFTGEIETGLKLTFASHATIYYIASHTEASGDTTNIVISPVLTAAVADDEVITVGPHQLQIKIGDGNLTYNETQAREYKLNRGIIDAVRNGDQAPLDLSTTFAWTYITNTYSGSEIPSVEDFLKRRGPAAAYVSTGQNCDPYCVDLLCVNSPPTCSGVDSPVEIIRFEEFRYESLQHDAKAGTVAMSGKCNQTQPTVTRASTYP